MSDYDVITEAQVKPNVHLFQIAYSADTLKIIEEGYQILDNLKNERPDWFEYWPIRAFLMTEVLDEHAYYGFFSTRFRSKTGLSSIQVKQFIYNQTEQVDVFIFSPQPDMGAFFLNVFEQAEAFDSGMITTYEDLLRAAGISIQTKNIFMDSRQIVYSNYFVARPAFWRTWLALNENIFRLAEDPLDLVGAELRMPTNYKNATQRKVFLQERTASFILATDKRWRSVRYDAFKTAWSASGLNNFPTEAVISDALKIAFRETGDPEYIAAFGKIRQKLFESGSSASISVAERKIEPLRIADAMVAAEALANEGRWRESCEIYETYLRNPADEFDYIAHFNLAAALKGMERLEEAEVHLRKSILIKSDFTQGYLGLGAVLEQLQRPLDAISFWDQGLMKLSDEDGDASTNRIKFYNNIGRLKENLFDYAGAEQALSESLKVDGSQSMVLHHWIHLRQKQCEWPVLNDLLSREDLVRFASPLSILSLSDDPAEQLACAKRIVREKIKFFPRLVDSCHRYGHSKIRIGYLSADLCMHAVSLLTAELFELHDRRSFEVHAFCWSREDGTSFRERVRVAFDQFHKIEDINDEEAAELIRRNEIDILVDLHGLSGKCRPEIIARGPAPIQVTWLGYPGTTAIPFNDYVVADNFVMPPEMEPYFTERPIRLPTVFQVSDTTRVFGPEHPRSFYGLSEQNFVFCAFNNNYKITPELFDVWLNILNKTADSVLWLLEDNRWSRRNLIRRAEAAGIDAARLHFAGRIDPRDYLTRFRAADLFLDTTPYNAGTTANDALWAGLPILTCAGQTYVSRMAGSLLQAAGIPELITYSIDQYEAAAIYYATHPQDLQRLRDKLKNKKEAGDLFSTTRFVAEFESALKALI
jgi:predicted O-linked N-acetylglucosamine transferase (SPINDLY family)